MNYDHINLTLGAFEAALPFEFFTQAEKTQLARQAKIISYRKNQEVFSFEHRGEECFFLVAEGVFQLRLKNKQTKQFEKGEIFGEIALFNEKSRTGTIRAITDGTLIAICRECLLNASLLPSELRYKLAFTLAQKMAGYFHEGHLAISSELIERGESETVEFKNTIKYKDDIVQALCAFMNHRGGTVFVGVDDNGRVHGIGNVKRSTIDKYRQNIGQVARQILGALPAQNILYDVDIVNGKKILRIDCDPATSPVFYKKKSGKDTHTELFYVRNDSRNEVLSTPSEMVAYIQKRFFLQA